MTWKYVPKAALDQLHLALVSGSDKLLTFLQHEISDQIKQTLFQVSGTLHGAPDLPAKGGQPQ